MNIISKANEFGGSMENFRGAKLPLQEFLLLKELEKLIRRELTQVRTIGVDTVGFKVRDNRIYGLGLKGCGITSVPERIDNLESLVK